MTPGDTFYLILALLALSYAGVRLRDRIRGSNPTKKG